MNLQTTTSQINIFPLGFGGLRADENLKSPKNYNKQEAKLFEEEKVEPIQKDNLILSREAIAVIGINGKRRFDEFKDYPNGWYGGKGRKLSKGSLFVFEKFIKYLPELKFSSPSLFFTFEGNLQLGLEDKSGNTIEVEFFSDKIEYYLESLEEENFVKLGNISQLVEKTGNLLK